MIDRRLYFVASLGVVGIAFGAAFLWLGTQSTHIVYVSARS